MNISYLLFANDIREDSVDKFKYCIWVIVCIELVLRLKVNQQKSEMALVGEEVGEDRLARLFGCKLGSFIALYLCLAFANNSYSWVVWELVVKGLKKKTGVSE